MLPLIPKTLFTQLRKFGYPPPGTFDSSPCVAKTLFFLQFLTRIRLESHPRTREERQFLLPDSFSNFSRILTLSCSQRSCERKPPLRPSVGAK